MTDRIVVDPALGHKLAFRNELDEGGVEVTRIEMWVEPGGGVPPHVHPSIEESFTVLEGTAELLGGRSWRPADPGETVVVSPGTRHAYRNRADGVAHVICIAKPASASLEEFLTEAAELNRRGLLTKSGLPKRPAAILPAVALAHRHREMVTLGFPLPPAPIQRAARKACRAARRRLSGGHRIAIHGTSGPLGEANSHGCVRASDADVRELVARVPLGAWVRIHG